VEIKKLTVGVLPAAKVFALSSEWGKIADALRLRMADKPIRNPEFFKMVAHNSAPGGGIRLSNDDSGASLIVTPEAITFTKERYASNAGVNVDKLLEEFQTCWDAISSVVKIGPVRRLGLVAEHRVSNQHPSDLLLRTVTKVGDIQQCAKFSLQFENHLPTIGMAAPDIESADFINVIQQFYDSALDIEESEDHAVNANVDVQRYFMPHLTEGIRDGLKQLRKDFDKHRQEFLKNCVRLGVLVQ